METGSSDEKSEYLEISVEAPGTPEDEMEIIEEVSIDASDSVHHISHETEVETIIEDDQEESGAVDDENDVDDDEDLEKDTNNLTKDPAGHDLRYNQKERIRLVLLHAEHPNNPRRVKMIFEAEFHKRPPATRTISKMYNKFLETGSVQNNYQKVRPRRSRTDENVERVKQAFQKSPTKSIRKIAQELKIPHSTVSRILQELRGKEAGQIRRCRTLKVGLKKSDVKTNNTAAGSDVMSPIAEQVTETLTTTGSDFVTTSAIVSQQQQQQQNSSLLTLQTQPIVATIRTQPSIFILETAPSRNVLASLFNCLDFACKKHSTQRRKDPEQTPYINHPIGVANILINEGGVTDLDVLQAAILHDTLEDTDTTVEELRENFGEKVTSIVLEVTDDKTQSKEVRKLMQIEHAPKCSHQAQLVKMADKIYNLRDLTRVLPVGWTEERRLKYVLWAQDVVTQIYGANEALAKILKDIFLHWNVLTLQ